ncbi:lysophospholipid acyltransferase 5 [Nephila pilipes]|uniref:Lysophospholipid acyltransferase 5 n=1 Tax=Nephila pilipes TaxID=299642 RepID=A0A8X6PJU1_NEPPI|nr:lysophospholipid acyltransferase 5 [Nephila pilipes]
MAESEAGSGDFNVYVAELLGAPEPVVRLILTILLGYPLALLRHCYLFGEPSILPHLLFVSCVLSYVVYDYGFVSLHHFCLSTICEKNTETLSNEKEKTALKKYPSLLEIVGHAYFFGGFIVDPQIYRACLYFMCFCGCLPYDSFETVPCRSEGDESVVKLNHYFILDDEKKLDCISCIH